MSQLRVTDAGGDLSFRWRCADYERFCAIRDALRATFDDEDGLHWVASARSWRLPSYHLPLFRAFADVWFPDPDEQVWTEVRERTRTAGARGGRRGSKKRSTRTESRAGTPLDDAKASLYLRADAPLWACEAVYRAAQKRMHPDVAGSDGHAAAVALNDAIAVIRAAHQARATGAA
jgi:hypothetical protein